MSSNSIEGDAKSVQFVPGAGAVAAHLPASD